MKKKSILALTILVASLPMFAEVTLINAPQEAHYNSRPMMIDISAGKCQLSREFSSAFDAVAKKYDDLVDFYRIDILSPESREWAVDNVYHRVPGVYLYWGVDEMGTVTKEIRYWLETKEEIAECVEEVLLSHYTQQPSSGYQNVELIEPFLPAFNDFLGVWKGVEGHSPVTLVFESNEWGRWGECLEVSGQTDNDLRRYLIGDHHWVMESCEWEKENNSFSLSDIQPSQRNPYWQGQQDVGMVTYRDIWKEGENLKMRVRKYNIHHDDFDEDHPYDDTTITLSKVDDFYSPDNH